MEFRVHEHEGIVVTIDGELFLRINRRQGWRLTTELYKGDILILKAKASNILPFRVSIKYLDLPDSISLERNKFTASLYVGNNELRLQMRLFKRPNLVFYLNDTMVGYAQSAKWIMIGYASYKINLEVAEEDLNLYFLILFLLSIEPV